MRIPVLPQVLFHGTTHLVDGFRPLTHFGSLRAAMERLSTRRSGADRIYPVALTIRSPITVTDGSAIINHRPSTYAQTFQKKGVLTALEADDVCSASVHQGDENAAKILCRFMGEHGYDGLFYRNRFEDVGSTSWCIFEAAQAEVIGAPTAFT